MLTTAVLFGVTGVSLLSVCVVWALLLRLGLAWANAGNVAWRRVALATAVVSAIQTLLQVGVWMLLSSNPDKTLSLAISAWLLNVVVNVLLIAKFFRISFRRALLAWLPTLLSVVYSLGLAVLVIKPFVFEAFVNSTNGSAPTLLGEHWRGICPRCGRPSYCTHDALRDQFHPRENVDAICENFHIGSIQNVEPTPRGPDRFLIAKYLRPNRWDLVAFRFPADPAIMFIKRLVGLPGETITIRDGVVYANGNKLELPPQLAGLTFPPPEIRVTVWGDVDQPAALGGDEYFAIGDFSTNSADSRTWDSGAPGHNVYAVPAGNIVGVATHIYWPIKRWRILR